MTPVALTVSWGKRRCPRLRAGGLGVKRRRLAPVPHEAAAADPDEDDPDDEPAPDDPDAPSDFELELAPESPPELVDAPPDPDELSDDVPLESEELPELSDFDPSDFELVLDRLSVL